MKKLLNLFLTVSLVLFLGSCHKDDKPEGEKEVLSFSDYWMMPSTNFGASLASIDQAEIARGFTTVRTDKRLLLIKDIELEGQEDVELIFQYIGDDDNNYRYAKCELPLYLSGDFIEYLQNNGYQLKSDYSKDENIKVYLNSKNNTFVTYTVSGIPTKDYEGETEFIFGPVDESIYSWTRLQPVVDLPLWTPFLGYDAPAELLVLYEKMAGHKTHNNTDVSKGFYFYETGDEMIQAVAYWLDEETQTKLEQVRIYFDPQKKTFPTVDEVNQTLNPMGYVYTTSLSGEDESQIYFDYDLKKTAYVGLTEPDDFEGTFLPAITFVNESVEGKVPPRTIQFPWLPVEVYKITIDEAISRIKAEPWYNGQLDNYLDMFPMFATNIEEFPYVILMDFGDGMYGSGAVFAESTLALRSLSIRDKIVNEYGCVYKEGSSLYPTFTHDDDEVPWGFQYIFDAGMWGYPCLVVEPQ